MAHYDPTYGQLLTSKETAMLTGLTINQLRNIRRNPKPGSLPFLQTGTTSWYRESDVQQWIEENGTIKAEYVVPDGSTASPLIGSPTDSAKREALIKLANINTENAWNKWYEWLLADTGREYALVFNENRDLQKYYYSLINDGENIDTLYPDPKDFAMLRKKDPFRFWPAFTYAIRNQVAKVHGWEVTDTEILSAPVGEVPPNKIK